MEFFDSAAGLAVRAAEPVSFPHALPGRRLPALVERIAMTRGSPIVCGGDADLRLQRESGGTRVMQPDEMVFLRPEQAELAKMQYLRVGSDAYPEVVLEVDHTRDIRGDKLKLYEEWGFPELWVEVPNTYSLSRPARLKPGLRIYLLTGDRYETSEESRAFPGWRAPDIHRALNERVVTPAISAVLERVGRALGEREGTGPDDDPLLGSVVRRKRAEGRVEGRAEGRAEERERLLRRILVSRGIRVSESWPEKHRRALVRASDEAVLAAGNAAESEADFLARFD